MLIYLLLTMRMPFTNRALSYAAQLKHKLSHKRLSGPAAALLRGMLCPDPHRRASIGQVAYSPYIQSLARVSSGAKHGNRDARRRMMLYGQFALACLEAAQMVDREGDGDMAIATLYAEARRFRKLASVALEQRGKELERSMGERLTTLHAQVRRSRSLRRRRLRETGETPVWDHACMTDMLSSVEHQWNRAYYELEQMADASPFPKQVLRSVGYALFSPGGQQRLPGESGVGADRRRQVARVLLRCARLDEACADPA